MMSNAAAERGCCEISGHVAEVTADGAADHDPIFKALYDNSSDASANVCETNLSQTTDHL